MIRATYGMRSYLVEGWGPSLQATGTVVRTIQLGVRMDVHSNFQTPSVPEILTGIGTPVRLASGKRMRILIDSKSHLVVDVTYYYQHIHFPSLG